MGTGQDHNPSLSDVIGQSTAIVGLFVSLAYGSGLLVVAIQLWIRRLPALSVVGVLPRDPMVAKGLPLVFLPALIGAMALASWLPALVIREGDDGGLICSVTRLAAVGSVSGVAVGALAGIIAVWTRYRLLAHLISKTAPLWLGLTAGAATGICVTLATAASVFWRAQRGRQSFWLPVVAFALALTPGIASIVGAASTFPAVRLCYSRGHILTGNLLGTADGHDYIAIFRKMDSNELRRGILVLPVDSAPKKILNGTFVKDATSC